ncbi:MAG: hypothetical protein K2R98_03825 [Gemmataceae bacterium]|nr:hypothetical protein [Gemmataceae bacterium]
MSDVTENLPGSANPELPPAQIRKPQAYTRNSLVVTIIAASIVAALVASILTLMIQSYRGGLLQSATVVQEGKAVVSGEAPVEVYYATPFGNTPNLTLDMNKLHIVIVEQKADHFTVRKNTPAPSVEISWKAEGQAKAP